MSETSDTVIGAPSNTALAILRLLRPHHWIKNILVFVPAGLAHTVVQPDSAARTGLAFISFCLAASGGYILNDLFDLEADRHHPVKKARPLATGALPIRAGLLLAPALLGLALLIAALVSSALLGVLAAYEIVAMAYTTVLKRVPVTDVFTLAALYTFRILAGGAAASVPISPWLASFSVFFFLSLALLKRAAELVALADEQESLAPGRGYAPRDVDIVRSLGTASAYVSVLIMALYINSNAVVQLYSEPRALWFLTILFLFWITRFWFLADRGMVRGDPLVFAGRDPTSYVIGALIVVTVIVATL